MSHVIEIIKRIRIKFEKKITFNIILDYYDYNIVYKKIYNLFDSRKTWIVDISIEAILKWNIFLFDGLCTQAYLHRNTATNVKRFGEQSYGL